MKPSKEFLEQAAQFGYYTPDNVPEHIMNDPYFKGNFSNYLERYERESIPDGLMSIEGIQVCVFMKLRPQYKNFTEFREVELYYCDYTNIFVFFNETKDFYMLTMYKNKFQLSELYEINNKLNLKLPYYIKEKCISNIKQPNKIGTFTFKKLNDWRMYCLEYVKALEFANIEIDNKKAKNEKIIEDFILSLNGKCEIRKYHNITEVNTKHFTITFELYDNGNSMSKKIIYCGSLENIATLEK